MGNWYLNYPYASKDKPYCAGEDILKYLNPELKEILCWETFDSGMLGENLQIYDCDRSRHQWVCMTMAQDGPDSLAVVPLEKIDLSDDDFIYRGLVSLVLAEHIIAHSVENPQEAIMMFLNLPDYD
jgi:hypothetical protein